MDDVDNVERRVSDQEREEAADVVRRAAGEGRLTFVELEERLENIYASKTYGELVKTTADLPEGRARPTAVEPASPTIRVFLSDTKRVGSWLVPQRQRVTVLLGEVTLDYTEAEIPHPEVFIDADAVLAEIKIRVPSDAVVHLDGRPILGSISEKGTRSESSQPAATPTVFHVKGTAFLGEIKIKRGPRLSKRLGLS